MVTVSKISPDGRELFYSSIDGVAAVQVKSDTAFHPGKRETVFEEPYFPYLPRVIYSALYDIHPKGKHFLMTSNYV